jgi:carbon-monoxide dehydrogenase small subunit
MTSRHVTVEVNETTYDREIEPRMLLSDFLRHELRLTGTHVGCEHGICGACTIQLDGEAIRSCLVFAVQAHGKTVRTVEGMADGDELAPLQTAFSNAHALQCGFCTPGLLMSIEPILDDAATMSEAEIREALAGNVCRCTGYQGIVEAVVEVVHSRGRAPINTGGGQ